VTTTSAAAPARASGISLLTFGTVSAINTLGFGFAIMALMFSGPAASGYGMGVGVFILSSVIHAVYTAWRDRLPGAIGIVQEAGIPVIAAAMSTTALQMSGPPEVRVATVLAILGVSTSLTGLLLLIVGRLRLGSLVRFVPYPVIAGFLAGAGWLMLSGGLSLVLGAKAPLEMLRQLGEPTILARAIPALLFAISISVGTRRLAHPFVIPGALVLAGLTFFAITTLGMGLSTEEIRALGWLPAASPAGRAISFPSPALLPLVVWSDVLRAAPAMASAAVLALLGILLNTSGLELALGVDLDPDEALRSSGLINLLLGGIGGMAGFVSVGGTMLAERIGIRGRSAGLARATVLLALLAVAGTLVAAMPVFLTGGLVMFLGIELLLSWAVASRRRLPALEWAIVPLILVVISGVGFLAGIGVGLLVAVGMFAFTYSRLPVVRFSASGRDLRSSVDRSPAAMAHLAAEGAAVEIVHLQGFLFFGTAERVLDHVRARLAAGDQPTLRFLVLDFRHVSGVDSAATACFLKLRKLTESRHVDVRCTEVPDTVVQQFARAGLTFDTTPTFGRLPDVNSALERCEDALLADHDDGGVAGTLLQQLEAQLGPSPYLPVLVEAMEAMTVPAGTFLIRAGDEARDLFLVVRGHLAVQVAGPDGTPLRLRTMAAGAIVGEIALYTRQPRVADVIAVEESVVCRLSEAAITRLEAEQRDAAVLLHRLIATNLSGKLAAANRLLQRARL
jgi:sulfate permease, SulP family